MQKTNFEGLMVKLASSDTIEQWSHGIVDHADTINYRTGKPKQKWLFCESIFWPVKNYECSCGKYKGVRYKGIVCERCGVEVTSSRVRRERMGHIELASPVIHVRYQNSVAGWVHHLLGLSGNEIQKILSFVKYVVTSEIPEEKKEEIIEKTEKDFTDTMKNLDDLFEQEKTNVDAKAKKRDAQLKDLEKKYNDNKDTIEQEFNRIKSIIADLAKGSTILESDYRNIFQRYDDLVDFKSGPDAVYLMLKHIDVKKEIQARLDAFRHVKSSEQKKKAFALIKLLINLLISGVRPENMVLTRLPVIPPDLRPVVQLEGGKFASSDVNLFYRRVLMRNIRLKKMIQVGMPDVVKKNEIRLLQESINNLLVGEKNSTGRGWAGIKVFKSLSDMLSGKEGIFRKNLLGKRVDYSGRSVITVWPHLKLDQCGLPLYIAVKMFTPFIIGKLIERKIVYTPKQAEKLIKEGNPVALRLLEEVIKDKYVLLNRAPTLHRLSIEAFKIVLMPWKTIRLHPLVCPSFNADFDWDQMAVHLPISDEAQEEAKELIAADKNILKPSSGEPTITHSQDMVLGVYHLTADNKKGAQIMGHYASIPHVLNAYEAGNLSVKDKILLQREGEHMETTVGKVIVNDVLPESIRYINETIGKKQLKKMLNRIFDECGLEETVRVADALKDFGFKFATKSGLSINVFDITVPDEKDEQLKMWEDKVNKIYSLYFQWLLSDEEKHRLIVQIWTDTKNQIEELVKKSMNPEDNLFVMIDSWARWSFTNTTQMGGMKWLVLNPKGEVIELPIKGNFVEWLTPIEYFISSHASRKGKADTALRTAESGYLTRKLCDSSQEVIIREEDCGSENYLLVTKHEAELIGTSFDELLYGRTLAEAVIDSHGTTVIDANTVIEKENLQLIKDLDLEMLKIRSPLTCHTSSGVCRKCYGMDLATRKSVEIGAPIGIIAAQSIGEPATQLTMNTFHGWGTQADKWDITQGIDRVKQLFEMRPPKNPALIAPFDGTVTYTETGKMRFIHITSDYQEKTYLMKEWYTIAVKKNEHIAKWGVYAIKGRSKLKIKEEWVVLEVKDDHIIIGIKETIKKSLTWLQPLHKEIDEPIYKGQVLTTGQLDIKEYKDIVGDLEAQKYVIREIKQVYSSQWQSVNDKHIELVVKQLFSKVFIEDAGDSSFVPGTHVKYEEFLSVNRGLAAKGKREAIGRRLCLGLTHIAKQTDSRLSAASFQETIRVMVDSSLKWAIDELNDLKSNVIIGRLLPLGEEYRRQLEESKKGNIVVG